MKIAQIDSAGFVVRFLASRKGFDAQFAERFCIDVPDECEVGWVVKDGTPSVPAPVVNPASVEEKIQALWDAVQSVLPEEAKAKAAEAMTRGKA